MIEFCRVVSRPSRGAPTATLAVTQNSPVTQLMSLVGHPIPAPSQVKHYGVFRELTDLGPKTVNKIKKIRQE